jgi:hypothetical protein
MKFFNKKRRNMKIKVESDGVETMYPVRDRYKNQVYKVLEALSELG